MPLHPQSEAFLAQIAAQDAPAWHELPPSESRSIFNSFKGIFGTGPSLAEVVDATIAEVPVRIYRSQTESAAPAIVYFHGGGWVLGNLDTHDSLCRRLAQAAEQTVVAVDYRLAPEAPYPAALDDCVAVTQALLTSGERWNVRPDAVRVAGDSAGGNLAAGVCLRARDDQFASPAAAILIYPVVHPDFESASYRDYATEHGLTRETMQWFWQQYVPDGGAGDRRHVELFSASLENLPPTHILTAEYDVLCSEGEELAVRLKAAGVEATHTRYPGMLHGFVHFGAMFDDSDRAIGEIASYVQKGP